MFSRRMLGAVFCIVFTAKSGWSASGTEGASFLDIPVGGGPAALGSAYSAQANDAYAPVWNPAGLGFLHSFEFTGMHLNYIESTHYEFAGLVIPLGEDRDGEPATAGIGAAAQYLGTDPIDARAESGAVTGTFSSAFAAYSLAFGQRIGETFSFGVTGKLISEKISDTSASAYAADAGLLYKPTSRLNLAAVLANVGSEIKFVNEADSLPTAARLGATYQINPTLDLSCEGVYRKSGLGSGSVGVEWRSGQYFSFRGGYNTSRTKELGAGAGITAGIGLFFWGQEFSYAWVPVGDLGQTHYFSIVLRASSQARPERPHLKKPDENDSDNLDDMKSDYQGYHDIFDFLSDDEKKPLQ